MYSFPVKESIRNRLSSLPPSIWYLDVRRQQWNHYSRIAMKKKFQLMNIEIMSEFITVRLPLIMATFTATYYTTLLTKPSLM